MKQMLLKSITILSLFSFFLLSCGNGEQTATPQDKVASTKSKQEPNLPYDQVIVVLCDYSKSLDSNTVVNMSKKAYQIVNKAPVRSRLIFLPMENNIYSEPLLDFTKKSKPGNAAKQKMWNATQKNQAKKIGDKIFKTYHTKNLQKSCILAGFKAAYITFKKHKNVEKKLIVMSDMLECCNRKFCGEKIKDYNEMMEDIPNHNFVDYPIGNLVEVQNVFVVVNSSNANNYNQIQQSKEFIDYWNAIAKELAFSESMNFLSSLPQFLE